MVILTRAEAGSRLAMGLMPLIGQEQPVVVALSPGGISVGAEIARRFEAPLDVLPAARLQVPGRPRSVFGAIAGDTTLITPERVVELGLPESYVAESVRMTREEVVGEARTWRGGAPAVEVQGKTVVLADDGTGASLSITAAIDSLRKLGAQRVIFASPVVCADFDATLSRLVDARVLLYDPSLPVEPLVRDPAFAQTTRQDVRNLVRRSRPELAPVSRP